MQRVERIHIARAAGQSDRGILSAFSARCRLVFSASASFVSVFGVLLQKQHYALGRGSLSTVMRNRRGEWFMTAAAALMLVLGLPGLLRCRCHHSRSTPPGRSGRLRSGRLPEPDGPIAHQYRPRPAVRYRRRPPRALPGQWYRSDLQQVAS